jgi:hypothetical protein
MFRKILLLIVILFTSSVISYSQNFDFKGVWVDFSAIYVVRLNNGDILTGKVLKIDSSSEKGVFMKFETMLGNPLIYQNEVVDFYLKDNSNRQRHRTFIMPTAFPIGDDLFISNYELAFFYAGFGVYDILSVTGGRSAIPTLLPGQQISVINAKLTLINIEWDNIPGGMKMALGGNLTFINDKNRLSHIYGNVTFYGDRTDITANIYTKTGAEDYYQPRFNNELIDMTYENGAFGIGLGITTKISERHGFYFLGELWNNNIAKMTSTALLGGLRVCNSNFSADFGLLFFTVPYIFPVVNFVWTPL